MKNLLLFVVIVLLVSCNSAQNENAETESAEMASVTEERAIGFNTMLPDLKFHMGNEDAIQVVKDLDEKWSAFDYEGDEGIFC